MRSVEGYRAIPFRHVPVALGVADFSATKDQLSVRVRDSRTLRLDLG